MSLFSAMNTAVSGLSAQSSAFGNISDNVANSQTVGFKRVDTSFEDLVAQSTPDINDPGGVVARPDYINTVQGTVSQTDNPLSLAITGNGFFQVSQQNGTQNTQPTFSPQPLYTRTGDFTLDQNRYLVNSAGYFLNGWSVNPVSGTVNPSSIQPIQVSQTVLNPVPTSQVTLSANLPATPATSSPVATQIQVYDGLGKVHTVSLNWTQTAANVWTVSVNSPDDTAGAALGTAQVQFGSTSGNPVPDGSIGSISSTTGSVTGSTYSANGAATLSFTANFGSGPQPVQLNLGTYGQAAGLTQFAGSDYTLHDLSQNGVAAGNFTGLTMKTNGDVVANYDNGQSRTIARIPLVTFDDPGALQRQNGQAFTSTVDSGTPIADAANSNGAGSLATSSVESSNVDIAQEFSKL
ncbi:MAG: flagellar hook protein FlgE, partial [Acetobacteraceae bacterium]|nr:flagellar hook protein FlgE [Acetobacteraceae bacterium]